MAARPFSVVRLARSLASHVALLKAGEIVEEAAPDASRKPSGGPHSTELWNSLPAINC